MTAITDTHQKPVRYSAENRSTLRIALGQDNRKTELNQQCPFLRMITVSMIISCFKIAL